MEQNVEVGAIFWDDSSSEWFLFLRLFMPVDIDIDIDAWGKNCTGKDGEQTHGRRKRRRVEERILSKRVC
jgi:hypothetical protein